MRETDLETANEIVHQTRQLEKAHKEFRDNFGFGSHLPICIKISPSSSVWSQTEITDDILIQVILSEVENRFNVKIKKLKIELKNLIA
jgi:hypothetical protein